MQEIYYDNFLEANEIYLNYYDYNKLLVPSISLKCYEDYINNVNDYFYDKVSRIISDIVKNGNMECYLFVIKQQEGLSEKMFDYYKVWKRIQNENEIVMLECGKEERILIDNQMSYISVGKFERERIIDALKFLFSNQYNAFIFCSKTKNLLETNFSKEVYQFLYDDNNFIDRRDKFGLKKFFEVMGEKDILIRVQFDGEIIGIYIYEKNR